MRPEEVARQWFREVWDEGREDAIERLMAPDALAHGLGAAPIRGPEEFKPLFRMFREALGDLQIEVARTVVEGDLVAVHCCVRGKHVGNAFGGAPTWRPVEFWGMTILRVRDGLIVEGWNSFDFLSMYQQLGWVPNPPLPAA
jgi:predicted ester cyclase